MSGTGARQLGVWWLLLAAVLLAFALVGCRDSSVATLDRISGTADRDHRASVGQWERAAPGDKMSFGDGARTRSASKAVFRLFDESTLELEPNTQVRFLERPSGSKGARLDVEMGQVTLEATEQALDLEMQVGNARIEARGKVRLTREGNTTRLEVVIGSARLLNETEVLELRVGDAVDIMPDHSLRPRTEPSAAAPDSGAAPPESPAAPSDSAGADAGDAPTSELESGAAARARGPSVVDLFAAAGDSFVVHDPKPPTAIGFTQSRCPGGAVLTMDPDRRKPKETEGGPQVSAEWPAGRHRYQLACREADGSKGKPFAEGTISVVADAGVRQLARTAPATSIDVDGRTYTVLYQTLLPKISVTWPGAPQASGYTLKLQSSSGTRTFGAASASYSFAPGALAEGDHVLVFEASGKRSKQTRVAIRFDNAAPTASIASPGDKSFGPGQTVVVSGSALPGWKVSVAGRELTQDAQNRFSEQLVAPAAERALAIRFAHPGRGIHYYLRRSAR